MPTPTGTHAYGAISAPITDRPCIRQRRHERRPPRRPLPRHACRCSCDRSCPRHCAVVSSLPRARITAVVVTPVMAAAVMGPVVTALSRAGVTAVAIAPVVTAAVMRTVVTTLTRSGVASVAVAPFMTARIVAAAIAAFAAAVGIFSAAPATEPAQGQFGRRSRRCQQQHRQGK